MPVIEDWCGWLLIPESRLVRWPARVVPGFDEEARKTVESQ